MMSVGSYQGCGRQQPPTHHRKSGARRKETNQHICQEHNNMATTKRKWAVVLVAVVYFGSYFEPDMGLTLLLKRALNMLFLVHSPIFTCEISRGSCRETLS